MASASQGGKRFSALSEGCESLWLLHMEAEYIGFLVSVESEMRLLGHIQSCPICKRRIADIFTGDKDPADELEELFSINLPEKMGGSNPVAIECPKRVDYQDSDAYIDARIKWRLSKLGELMTDAELELTFKRTNKRR